MHLLFDIDGTLIDMGKYPDEFKNIVEKIDELKENGSTFGIASGRAFDKSVKKIYKDYHLNGDIFTENGARINRKSRFGKYKELGESPHNLNRQIKSAINIFLNKNNLKIKVKIGDPEKIKSENIVINKNRKMTATLYIPENIKLNILSLEDYLRKTFENMQIERERDSRKICLFPKNLNKIEAIKAFYGDKNIILVTDFERFIPSEKKSVKVYSIGTNLQFNQICDEVYPSFGKGIEEILKNKEKIMKNYEVLSENCKILWLEGFEVTKERYTQVSGYIFNDKNQLLIVKNGKTWTIPGGHPEEGETKLETLEREIMEEACVKIQDERYIGAVEVVENGETYYQLRYTARVKEVLPFAKEWETSERKFVDLDDLHNYITWSKGVTFSAQIDSSKKVWKI